MTNTKKMTLGKAFIPIVCLVALLIITVRLFKGGPHIPIFLATIVAATVAMKCGYTWNDIEKSMLDTIYRSLQAILILVVIGVIIGTWIASGVVPSMIYYGLKIISPKIFLITTCLICAIVSLSTGSSWTTAGTVGLALIGIGQSMNIPLPMVAGAIISGAYFGDKMSPLSDTTNLAPAMAETNLFDHIRHMIYTTGPSFVIALILYGVIGLKYGTEAIDSTQINNILSALSNNFNITPILLIPPILVIGMVIKKIPAIPGLVVGALLGGLFAIIFQGVGVGEIFEISHYGYASDTGLEVVDKLLSRGGIKSMWYTISLIMLAMCFGGILEQSGMLEVIANKILQYANSTGSLILATILTCIAINIFVGSQYLSIVVPGRMYKKEYDKRELHPKNLSRTLEDGGTITSGLVPWNTGGAFMYSTLGVYPLAYLPFAFLNIINPIIAIIYGYTGFTIEKMALEEKSIENI